MDQIKNLSQIIAKQSILKQDVYEVTKSSFSEFKLRLEKTIAELKKLIPDSRVRLILEDKGDFEVHAYIGSDLLVFQMHTNIFSFPKEHGIWKSSYVEEHRDRAYCGIINIYNFLADSFLQDRFNDSGFLIGRIFVNCEKHFFIEGRGALGILYRDFINQELREIIIDNIIQSAIQHVLKFELHTPAYSAVNQVSVAQMKMLSSSLQLKTAKRLGFKFGNESKE